MATAAISLPDSLNRLEQAVLDNLRERFQEWSQCRLELVQWEKRHLCDEQPDPEKLAEHKKAIERLIFLGQIFSFAISHPEFPDAALVENVGIEQWILRELFLTFVSSFERDHEWPPAMHLQIFRVAIGYTRLEITAGK